MDVIGSLEKDLESSIKNHDDVKARYKIEVQFGKDRSISALKPSSGVVMMWESGKFYHGGGDDKMYWCGYADCERPIRSSAFGIYHLVCPHCGRECFLDATSKSDHVRKMPDLEKLPCVFDARFFRLAPRKLAELLSRIWYQLDCNADVYLKYHPSDIRYNVVHDPDTIAIPTLDKARMKRGSMIYPLKNILKDTSAGADIVGRLLAMVTA